ncbi:M1 family metallopeptidase [Sphingomonas sp.]|uniref:M1 family metallopeptidase n=1 Tax=Sphingomonas sp. TaxID=28214 RepID=UPI0025D01F7F|nr:M1 family metallopeptidase [Sphingomonas sp.]
MSLPFACAISILAGLPSAKALTQDAPPVTVRASGRLPSPDQRALLFRSGDLRIEFLPDQRAIKARAELRMAASVSLRRVELDLDPDLIVDSIAIDGAALAEDSWSHRDGKLTANIGAPLAATKSFLVTIAYHGQPHVAVRAPWDDGMVWSKVADGRPWAATTAQSSGCDLYWPCIDYPTFEPDYLDIHLTVPNGLKALSNGRLESVDTAADGRTTWNWHAKTPTLYTVAFNIGPYEEINEIYKSRYGNKFPMTYWYIPGERSFAEHLFSEFAPALDFYEKVIGPYPFADQKMAVVEVPYRGMEHQTITAYGGGYAKSPDGFDKLFHHEFGHEWFANQLTAADWDDFWLHEGFDAYMQPLYGRWREGNARYDAMMLDYRRRIRNVHPLVAGASRTSGEVDDARTGPGTDMYLKGAWVLHTLRLLIGDRAFFAATRELVYGRSDPRPGNFTPVFRTTSDFVTIVNRVTRRDYRWFFDVYLYQAALPRLETRRQGRDLLLRWKTPGDRPFPLPVELGVDGRIIRVAMIGNRGRVGVGADSHVVIDPGARILMQSDGVDAYQAWADQQSAKP